MTTDALPIRRPRVWLLVGSLLAALSVAVLWPLQQVGQVCILIYPAPPGCGSDVPRWVPLAAVAVVIAVLAAMFVVYFTVARSRVILLVLAAVIVLVTALAAAIVSLSQTGIWDPYYPPILID